jgi:hypothetical protein
VILSAHLKFLSFLWSEKFSCEERKYSILLSMLVRSDSSVDETDKEYQVFSVCFTHRNEGKERVLYFFVFCPTKSTTKKIKI